jgi:type IV secretion system protein VirB11
VSAVLDNRKKADRRGGDRRTQRQNVAIDNRKSGERRKNDRRSARAKQNKIEPVAIIGIGRDTSLMHMLEPIQPYLENKFEGKVITDVAVNFPGSVFYEDDKGWHEDRVSGITEEWVQRLAVASARYAKQDSSEKSPIMSAELPRGERIQIVRSPAVEVGRSSLTIRVPDFRIRSMEGYVEQKMFNRVLWSNPFKPKQTPTELREFLKKDDQILVELLEQGDFPGFLKAAVKFHKNIAVIGGTGSGKTTLMKTLCEFISPFERILTVEDVRELFKGSTFRNTVHMLYSKGKQGVADVMPADLLAAANRMKPDRVLLTELRGSEAFDVLKLLTSGNKGLITSYHADNPQLGFERFSLMAGEHPDARAYSKSDLKRVIESTMDIILHITADLVFGDDGMPIGKDRYGTELYYDPIKKMQLSHGDGGVVHV